MEAISSGGVGLSDNAGRHNPEDNAVALESEYTEPNFESFFDRDYFIDS